MKKNEKINLAVFTKKHIIFLLKTLFYIKKLSDPGPFGRGKLLTS